LPTPEPIIRKRKGSPKALASSQRKRPRAIHSATLPLAATKHTFTGSSLKGKEKRRQGSLDSDSTPDLDVYAEIAIASSQRMASASISKRKGARKSVGGNVTLGRKPSKQC
jgi:hypothetical protein